MKDADILIKNADIITLDGETGEIRGGYVAIKGGKIASVGQGECELTASRIINAGGNAVMPGLVNAHMHVPMLLLRGYGEDHDLHTWLNDYIFPAEAKMDARSIGAGALLGIAEMLASGTTSFSDMYNDCDAIAAACDSSGIKANISRGLLHFGEEYDFEADPRAGEMRQLVKDWHGHDNGRIKIEAAIHAEYTSNRHLWEAVAGYARQNGLGIHLHLSETKKEHIECIERHGKTPAEVFYEAGVFDGNHVSAAHCVWVSDEDMDILKSANASLSHNPTSNLKLGSGVARLPLMLKKGLNVSLGTDGVSSNNSADMFEALKLAAILHKGITLDPRAITARQAVEMACAGGAKAQSREGECGRIVPGMDADLIMLNMSRPGLIPCHSPISTAVYSARGGDVELTMVRGSILYEKGEFKTIDIEKVKRDVYDYALPRIFG